MEFDEQLSAALGERYRVERELGRGGMAVVFLAEDLKHRRRVAVKVVRPELTASLGGDRFLREIAIAATLQHPNILPLYDSGQAGGLLYYVMPFVDGESLRDRLARERPLPIDEALRIVRDVGGALSYAHEHGVVHRDIKPENILLSGGRAVVADFGIARAVHTASPEALTVTGTVLGTPQYMSPEQATGAVVDARGDQYSLACTLYEMLAGQPPFSGASAQAVMARHSLDPVPGLRVVRQTVPASVEAAIVQAMSKLPPDRFATIDRFVAALEPQSLSQALTVEAPVRSAPASGRGRALGLAVAIALTLAAAAWLMSRGLGPRSGTGSPGITSVAVLPFRDMTSDPDSAYLAAGVTAGLLADLSEIGSLKVVSGGGGDLSRAMPLSELASRLSVQAVVNGSIRRSGDSVRVSLQFLRAPDSTALVSRMFEGGLGDLPDLQRQMAEALGASIAAQRAPGRGHPETAHPVDPRAYEAYLRGRFFMDRGEMDRVLPLFEQAVRGAPDWAPPRVAIAQYYAALPFYTDIPPARVLPQARAALIEALQLDEAQPEAHAVMAYVRAYYEWDWRTAEQEYRRALELRPSYADAYFSYGRFLASRRRLDEAIAQLDRAESLDPLSLSLQANRALLDYFAGRYQEAEKGLRDVLRSDSMDVTARWGLALVAEQQGHFDESIRILESIAGQSPNRISSLGHIYAMAGRTAQARQVLARLEDISARRYVPAYFFALLHQGLGLRDEALRDLERAYEERSTVLAYLWIDPRLASLREEPRFIALAQQLGGP